MTACKCTPHKVRYRDEIAAKLALASVQHKDGSRRSKSEKRLYHCPCCNGWHLTAKPRETKPRGRTSQDASKGANA